MSDIIGFEACSEELRRLLDEVASNIEAASKEGAEALHSAVMKETRKLVDFTNRTEPRDIFNSEEVENIRKIDKAADDARREIFGDSATAIINRMYDRISKLNQLEKEVKHLTAENKQKANKIRLIPVRNAIDAMTETVNAVMDTKNALSDDNPNEVALKNKIESAFRSIKLLEKAAKDLFEPG